MPVEIVQLINRSKVILSQMTCCSDTEREELKHELEEIREELRNVRASDNGEDSR